MIFCPTEGSENLTFIAKLVYSLPAMGWQAHIAKEYALPYQPISPVLLNWEVILGIAVAMMEESSERRNIERPSPAMTTIRGIPVNS